MKKLLSLFSGLLLLVSCLAQTGSAQTIGPGTEIQVQLLGQLDTGKAQPGDEFSATLAQPVHLDGGMEWPKGTQVKGTVVDVVSSGRLSRPASITLQLTQIGSSPLETQTAKIDGQSHAGRNVALIGGTAAVGALIGGIASGGKGALIGTAAGAGAGTAAAAATGKQEIVLRAETPLTFTVAGAVASEPQPSGPVPQPVPEQAEAAPPPQEQQQAADSFEPYTPEQLDNLLAPIALYPDPLLAQVLVAATFPDQIQDAAPWVHGRNPEDIDYQSWDVSVKAVAHYPAVLSMMNDRLDWTTALGQAYVYQSTDMMTSVQRLRNMAYSQGNLVPTPQQQVVVDRGYIQIVPAQPRVIFVPVYDPGVIYTRRVYRPGVGFGGYYDFGTGYAIGVWLNHDMDWGSHRVVYNSWDGHDGGWRDRSRPYVHVTNVYVNNRYETVRVNQTVVDRHVDYDNVHRYDSVHHDVTYENRARIEATRERQEPPHAVEQARPQAPVERANERDDRGFRGQPSPQAQPQAPQRPEDVHFQRPSQAPSTTEQARPQPQPSNERVNDKDDRGFRGQPTPQAQPQAPQQHLDNARVERPNANPSNVEQQRPQPAAQAQPQAPQRPNNASFERANPAPSIAAQPRPQPQPASEKINDKDDRNIRNQPAAASERPVRTAPQPPPQAAAPPPTITHAPTQIQPRAQQPQPQQQQHVAEKQNNKDKKEKDKDDKK